MQPVPVSNPPNPWASTEVEYLEAIPETRLHVYEDRTRSILATNDSPDLAFRWSVNPYRGCFHACAYCLDGKTPILLADGRAKPLEELRAGDAIYGTIPAGRYRRYVVTHVLDHWSTIKPGYRVVLEDGTAVIASGDHRFLTTRGWKHVTGTEYGSGRRPHLTTNSQMLGLGAFAITPIDDADYRRGYLSGLIRGDGLIGSYTYDGRRRARDVQHHFRLALTDAEALDRAAGYLRELDVATFRTGFGNASGCKPMEQIRTNARSRVERISELIAWPAAPSDGWRKGFLAGIFDAEGSNSRGIVRISNKDPAILDATAAAFHRLGYQTAVDENRTSGVSSIRLLGGLHEQLRFFHTVDPAITRKRAFHGRALKNCPPLRVVAIEPVGRGVRLFDITTGTGDFIANGLISHNCYARPGHEYLSFGAGTDFDRKIVVKPEAPRLLREAFERRSWKGELVVFSGVTDCYQPLEASYRLTRGCLEVCAQYRNPVGIITKSALIERDLDVLVDLHRTTHLSVSVSIPLWDEAKARAIEPFVTTPTRRVRTIERLARAGISVGVNVAPLIPGLSDEDVPAILEAAAAAGAKRAACIFLRLPGPVKAVFEERLRAAMPDRADKVLARVREARGGKLYDARFGVRQRGDGPYAEAAMRLFEATAQRLGLETGGRDEVPTTFARPRAQLPLFPSS